MENFSENRGRGRPAKFDEFEYEAVAAQFGLTTRRAQQDRLYAGRVISDVVGLYGDERCEWLVSDTAAKWGILAELGRLRESAGEAAFREALAWVLDAEPTTKRAVNALRRYRTGKRAPGSVDGLHGELTTAINDYLRRHPDSSSELVEEALVLTLESVRETRRGS